MYLPQDSSLVIPAIALLFLATLSFYLARHKNLGATFVPPKPTSKQQISRDTTLSHTPAPAPEVSKDANIPEGWYTDPRLFALERRAIFSKVSRVLLTITCPDGTRHGFV
jgi:hypothetical protein